MRLLIAVLAVCIPLTSQADLSDWGKERLAEAQKSLSSENATYDENTAKGELIKDLLRVSSEANEDELKQISKLVLPAAKKSLYLQMEMFASLYVGRSSEDKSRKFLNQNLEELVVQANTFLSEVVGQAKSAKEYVLLAHAVQYRYFEKKEQSYRKMREGTLDQHEILNKFAQMSEKERKAAEQKDGSIKVDSKRPEAMSFKMGLELGQTARAFRGGWTTLASAIRQIAQAVAAVEKFKLSQETLDLIAKNQSKIHGIRLPLANLLLNAGDKRGLGEFSRHYYDNGVLSEYTDRLAKFKEAASISALVHIAQGNYYVPPAVSDLGSHAASLARGYRDNPPKRAKEILAGWNIDEKEIAIIAAHVEYEEYLDNQVAPLRSDRKISKELLQFAIQNAFEN